VACGEVAHAVTRTDTALRPYPAPAHKRFRVVTHGIADLRGRTWWYHDFPAGLRTTVGA
jgi:hypothetical protein